MTAKKDEIVDLVTGRFDGAKEDVVSHEDYPDRDKVVVTPKQLTFWDVVTNTKTTVPYALDWEKDTIRVSKNGYDTIYLVNRSDIPNVRGTTIYETLIEADVEAARKHQETIRSLRKERGKLRKELAQYRSGDEPGTDNKGSSSSKRYKCPECGEKHTADEYRDEANGTCPNCGKTGFEEAEKVN